MIRMGKLCKGSWLSNRTTRLAKEAGGSVEYGRKTGLMSIGSNAIHTKNGNGETIVISGVSGRYPASDSVEELKENLYQGVDMISNQTRWQVGDKVPKRYGFMKNLDKFDANFFGINPKLADAMDPQQRKLLEVTFEAIVDAGINPEALRGSRTGVYVGSMGGEAFDYWLLKGGNEALDGYGAMGIPNFMMANRLSFTFDLKGPSLVVSTGCSASLVALEAAVQSIKSGNCDAAVVCGATIHVDPGASYDLHFLRALSPEGKCKTFDDEANGYVRSEACISMLIQKERDAKRVYASIKHIKSNSDGFKAEGLVFPSMKSQENLLRQTYEEAGIDPGKVSYFEAHGTGTPAGDPQELQAISNVLCRVPSRTQPLLIGSVKSNLGHPESAAGLASMSKVLLSIQQGILPPNLHFHKPNSFAKHLFDGSMKIVTESTPWDGGLVGISSFGLGGSNVHVILESGPKVMEVKASSDDKLPMLLPFSGRTEEAVEASLQSVCKIGNTNPEFASLIHNVFKKNVPGHGFRGYGLVRVGEEDEPIIQVEAAKPEKRPLWFIFPGMGSQWNEMGKDLMRIDAYSESIQKSRVTLNNAGIDLDHLLRPGNPSIFTNIRDSLVSITAVQIALYDTIMSLGVTPDGFLGHSSGEILCAYADGCLSAEEALLVGDARGRAFQESSKSPGGMAAVGLSWEELKSRCPPNLYPACHNVANNVSVSGPLELIRDFVKDLQQEGIFAKEINSCNCAPHSPYVYPALDLLFKYMNEIYQDDRPRTSRWISSSIPEAQWDHLLAKTSSPAYHVHNMGNSVLFCEAIQHVPSNAVVIEIAPHGLFQALLKGSLSPDCVLIAPMHSMVEDKLAYFLSCVGKIYNAGVEVNVGNLYPGVTLPASASTPFISPLVKWDHSNSWVVPIVENATSMAGGAQIKVDLMEKSSSYLSGHKLDSRIVFPATGYLHLAWKCLASSLGQDLKNVPVVFQNVSLDRATFLSEDKSTELNFSLLNGTGAFEIREGGATVVRGSIHSPEDAAKSMLSLAPTTIDASTPHLSLSTQDIYKELKLRGYNYGGTFKGIEQIDNEGKWAQVKWKGNWVSFLDAVLQTVSLRVLSRNTAVPIRFQQVVINPKELLDFVAGSPDSLVPVSLYSHLNTIKCPGVEIRGLVAMVIPRRKQEETLSLEEYKFTPYFDTLTDSSATVHSTAAGLIDLVLENLSKSKINIMDIFTQSENCLASSIHQIMRTRPRFQSELTLMSTEDVMTQIEESTQNVGKIVTREAAADLVPDYPVDLTFLDDPSLLGPISAAVNDNSYLILRSENIDQVFHLPDLLRISRKTFEGGSLSLFKKLETSSSHRKKMGFVVLDEGWNWLPKLQSLLNADSSENIYLISQNDKDNGIIGLIKCLRLEPGGDRLRCIFDPEGKLELNLDNSSPKLEQIFQQDLVMNIFRDDQLGSYRHFPIKPEDMESPGKEATHAFVNVLHPGDLSSLQWIEGPLALASKEVIGRDEKKVLCHVQYASLNFRDVMLATGRLPIDSTATSSHQDCIMGFEFSGLNSATGQRVMGLMDSKALASSVTADTEFLWEVPQNWSLEDAATVPMVYATAYYALRSRARLRPGQTVLIHSGTGGVGQAAINIALDLKCEVFTTVGSPEKREYLKKLFPQLNDSHIGNSRDSSFETLVLEQTQGRGVEVVLNSLAEDKLQASLRCLATNGKFLEIGAFDSFVNNTLGMSFLLNNVDFQGIFLNKFFTECEEERAKLRTYFADGLARGVIKPLSRTVFAKEEIEGAFRYMASGKHLGKVIIRVRDEAEGNVAIPAIPRSYFHPDKAYVIAGGLGGLGLEVANFLVDRGAKKLVLLSRRGVTNGYQDLCIRKWEQKGVTVETPTADLTNYTEAENLIQRLISEDGGIGGIFNSTLVLQDAPFDEQTMETFESVCAPKVVITKNLDQLSRKLCSELDHFVVFSSAACGKGNAYQSNYGFANSSMEQICEGRARDGLPGLVIQWGVIGEAGYVADKFLDSKSLTGDESFEGTVAQRISSCLQVLDFALQQQQFPKAPSSYSSMVLADKGKSKSNKCGLIATLTNIFGLKNLDKVSPSTKLTDLGMDSLVGMELKIMLERDYDLPLTPNELRALVFADLLAIDAGTFSKDSKTQGKVGDGAPSFFTPISDALFKLHAGDAQRTPFFLVHGLEGHTDKLQTLASKLKCDVYGFQFTNPNKTDSIEDLAKLYIQELKTVQPDGPYVIGGYSSGASVAYEIARQLENEHGDEVSNLVVLDGCFHWKSLEQLDMKHIFRLILETSRGILKFSDEEAKTFLDKVKEDDLEANEKLLINWVKGVSPSLSTSAIKTFVQRMFKLGQLIRQYEPQGQFKGRVHLIKAQEKSFLMVGVDDENHYLTEHCDEGLSIHTVPGNHYTFLDSDKVRSTAEILNQDIWDASKEMARAANAP